MRVRFCGVRGSTAAPGLDFIRVGGHTSCIAVSHDGEVPSLILDAGTGLRNVTELLGGEPFRGTILLTHMHWDHIQGLPFFIAADRAGAETTLVMPCQGDARELLASAMAPPHFPIGPEGLRGSWDFKALEPGEAKFEGFTVQAAELPHKGGRTFGYRVTNGGGSIAYMPDHAPVACGPGPLGIGEFHSAAMDLAEGVDVLVHGAQFGGEQLEMATMFGHATAEYAIALAEAAGVGRLLMFHHSPARTDDEMDAFEARYQGGEVAVEAAREGLEFVL